MCSILKNVSKVLEKYDEELSKDYLVKANCKVITNTYRCSEISRDQKYQKTPTLDKNKSGPKKDICYNKHCFK